MTFEKNGEYSAYISALGANGEGIVKLNGFTIFVPFALPGEKVKIKILKLKKNYAFGKALEIYTPVDERVRPKCPVFTKCGGCQLQHMKYSYQLKFKTKTVSDCLKKIAFLDVAVPLAVKSDLEYGYRNKLQLPVGRINGESAIGFYAANSHRIVKIEDCPIHPFWAADIISAFNEFLQASGVSAYDEETGEGILRHIVVRELGGRFIVNAVVNADDLPKSDMLVEILQKNFKNFSLFYNVNKGEGNAVTDGRSRLVYGESRYEMEEGGVKYEAGADTFLQVNEAVKQKIYDKAVKLAALDENTVVIDAYSGAGLLTAMLARSCKLAYGIESVAEAVECADALKIKNNLQNKMINVLGKCEEELGAIVEKHRGEKLSVVLDPPRKGCAAEVLQALKTYAPERIVYISCNPATLARDLGILTGSLEYSENDLVKSEFPAYQYSIEYIQPYDMFPQTKHVETVVLLSRQEEKICPRP